MSVKLETGEGHRPFFTSIPVDFPAQCREQASRGSRPSVIRALKQAAPLWLLCAAALPGLAQRVLVPTAGAYFAPTGTPHNGALIRTSASSSFSGQKSIHLQFPASADMSTFKVVLNGKDVSTRFTHSMCGPEKCLDGILVTRDGLRSEKNVLYATAKTEDGRLVSSRQRFDAPSAGKSLPVFRSSSISADANADNTALPTLSGFLPPSIALTTDPNQSGYIDGKPWITIGTQNQYPDASLQCNGRAYSVVVLDRRTLQEKTEAPESSPQCFVDDPSLTAYLKGSLVQGDLVIVATNYGIGTPNTNSLDTSSIGGTNYSKTARESYPSNYLAIGVAGAAPGQAYENYLTYGVPDSQNPPFAKGMFIEDINGNYNFTSSDAIEYVVAPNSSAGAISNYGMIQLGIPAKYQTSSINTNLYLPPYQGASANVGGFWLLVVDRITLQTVPAKSNPNGSCAIDSSGRPGIPATTAVYTNCGTFYPTNSPDSTSPDPNTVAVQQLLRLASDLNAVDSGHLAILTTIGNAGLSTLQNDFNWAHVADDQGTYGYWGPTGSDGTSGFFHAMLRLGVPPYATMQLWHDASANQPSVYTAVASAPLGGILNGRSVVSTTAYAQQGMTGYLHGTMTRDRLGLYAPSNSSQEGSYSTDSADYSLALLSAQQPVEWPELATLLTANPGGSIQGQQQAYRYISNYLISQIYLRETSGHQDDLHYFFTGSLNSFLDYHSYDPVSIPFPSDCPANTNCSVTVPMPDPTLGSATFTLADFNNVKQQISKEVVALTNVLAFLSTGSVNMKDIIAAGSSNVALALIQAASTIEASTEVPSSPATPVAVNSQNVLSLVSSVVGIGATIGTGGLVSPELVDDVDKGLSILGTLINASGSIAGGLTAGVYSTSIPNPDYTLHTTLAQLAGSDLQGSMSAGFDATADTILSDWNKLSKLASLVTDTSNTSYYAPNQTAQNAAVAAINLGMQRNIFLAIASQQYEVHFWPQVPVNKLKNNSNPQYGEYYPGPGAAKNGECNAFYYVEQDSIVPYSYAAFPSPSPNSSPFYVGGSGQYWGPLDGYVLAAGPFHNPGKGNAYSGNPTQSVTLFGFGNGPGQLNIPLEPFVIPGGPVNEAGNWIDLSVEDGPNSANYSGFSNVDICNAVPSDWYDDLGNIPTSPSGRVMTSTTLTAPDSVALGDSIALSAKVTASDGSIPSGTLGFFQGTNKLAEVTLDANGVATFIAPPYPMGSYDFEAYFTSNKSYAASTSNTALTTVFSSAPDMLLSLSTRSLPVTYGTQSNSVTLAIASKYGLAGNAELSCSGLPSGLACTFNPAEVALARSGNASAAFTIGPSGTAQASQSQRPVTLAGFGLLCVFAIPMLLSLGSQRRKLHRRGLLMGVALAITLLLPLSGCGNDHSSSPSHETGVKTILVNASVGNLTRSITLEINMK